MDEKLVAALIAFIAAIIATSTGLYWNFRNANLARKLPFLTKQLEYCFEASEMAARLAVCGDEVIWKPARKRFFELFFGPLAIEEDDDVARAMTGHDEVRYRARQWIRGFPTKFKIERSGAGSERPNQEITAPVLGNS